LVYSSEAILPTDVTFGVPRIQFYEEGEAEQTHRVDLDRLVTTNNFIGTTTATLKRPPLTLAT
jgi:hypothetical protein